MRGVGVAEYRFPSTGAQSSGGGVCVRPSKMPAVIDTKEIRKVQTDVANAPPAGPLRAPCSNRAG
jgi:hypothetical protein